MSYIGNSPSSIAFLTDTFSGNASATAFTLSAAPATTSSILVAVSGVLQDPSTYSSVGTTLTFSAAPPSGTDNISVRFLGIPASGVTTTAYRTVTEFTATASQTTFSVPSYTVGFIDVYRNGVLLGSADYTATNGTTVVLATGATSGDLVEVISFQVSSVLNAIPASPASVQTSYLVDGSVTTAKIADDAITTGKIAAGAVGTTDLANAAVTTAKLSQPFTSDTAVSATGTSIDFTGIPSWVKRITVVYASLSTNGSAALIVQLGDAGGVETSGYLGSGVFSGPSTGSGNSTAGLLLSGGGSDSSVSFHGSMIITKLTGNTYASMCVSGQSDSSYAAYAGGSKALSDTLDRIRITTANGTDVYDAGTINILYE
jgi:hypothetical protein